MGLSQLIPSLIYSLSLVAVYLSLFFNPFVGILYLFPILPYQIIFENMRLMPFGKDINDVVLITIFFSWLIRKIFTSGRLDSKLTFLSDKSDMSKPIIVFILITTFGLLISIYKFGFYVGSSVSFLFDWKNYMILPIIWFLTTNIVKTRKSLLVLTILLFIGIFGVAYYFYRNLQWMNLWHYSERARTTMSGIFVYLGPNHYGAFFAHFVFILIGTMLFIKSKIKKAILLGVISLMVYCLMYTYSRGAYLAFLVGLIFIGIIKDRRVLLLLFMFILVWRSIVPISVTERIDMTHNEYGQLEESAAKRVELWNLAWSMFKESPIIGNGLYSFKVFTNWDTHNMYMKILAESGVIGLMMFIYLLFASFMSGWRLFRKAKDDFFKGLGLGFSACVISLALTNAFGDRWSYVSLGSYFWIFLGIISRANIINKAELHSKSKSIKNAKGN